MDNKCGSCRYCCEYMSYIYPYEPCVEEWLNARGIRINQKNDKFIEAVIHKPCPHFRYKLGCKLQNKKPVVCATYPENIIENIRKCGLDVNIFLGKGCIYREDRRNDPI